MSGLTVILPCAGKGTRLGLPYPKEMHLVSEKTALIDFTFNRLERDAHLIKEVVVILSPEKGSLVEYLSKWRHKFYIKFIFFDENNFEWAGSILSAEKEFGERNIIFLPDSYLVGLPHLPILATFNNLLSNSGVCFGLLPEADRERLLALGAVKVEADSVVTFCDKPALTDSREFNAFWTTFGFTKEMGRPLLEMMTRSIQRENVSLKDLGVEASCFEVAQYKDLGVWPNIHEFTRQIDASTRIMPEN